MADSLYTKGSREVQKDDINKMLAEWNLARITGVALAEHLLALYKTGRANLHKLADGLQNGFEKSFRQHAKGEVTKVAGRYERDNLFLTNFTNILRLWPDARALLTEQQEIVDACDGAFRNAYQFLNSEPIQAIHLPAPTEEMNQAISAVNKNVAAWLGRDKFAELFRGVVDEPTRLEIIRKALASVDRSHMDLVTAQFVALLDSEQQRLETAIKLATERAAEVTSGVGSVTEKLRRLKAARQNIGQGQVSSATSSPVVERREVALGDLPPSKSAMLPLSPKKEEVLSQSIRSADLPSETLSSTTPKRDRDPSPSPRRLSASASRTALNAGLAQQYVTQFTADVSSKRLLERAEIIEAKLKGFAGGNNDELISPVVKLVQPQLEQLLEEVRENLQKSDTAIAALQLDPSDPVACLTTIDGAMKALDEKADYDEADAEVQQVLEERQAHITATKEQANKRFAEFQAASITGKELSLTAILDTYRDALAGLGSIEDVSERSYYKTLLDTANNRFIALKVQADGLHDTFNTSIADLTPQQAIEAFTKAIADIHGLDPLVAGHYKSSLEHRLHDMQEHVAVAEESNHKYLASIQSQEPTVRLAAIAAEIVRLGSDDSVAPKAKAHQLVSLRAAHSELQASITAAERLFDDNSFIFNAYQLDSMQCVWQVDQAMITTGIKEAIAGVDGLEIADPVTREHYVVLLRQADKTLPALMAAAIQQFDRYGIAVIESCSTKIEQLTKARTELVVGNRQDYHVSYLLEKTNAELKVNVLEAQQFIPFLCAGKLSPEQQLARIQAEVKVVETPLKLVLRRLYLLKAESELQESIRAAAERVAKARQEAVSTVVVLPTSRRTSGVVASSPSVERSSSVEVALGDLPPPVEHISSASEKKSAVVEKKKKKP